MSSMYIKEAVLVIIGIFVTVAVRAKVETRYADLVTKMLSLQKQNAPYTSNTIKDETAYSHTKSFEDAWSNIGLSNRGISAFELQNENDEDDVLNTDDVKRKVSLDIDNEQKDEGTQIANMLRNAIEYTQDTDIPKYRYESNELPEELIENRKISTTKEDVTTHSEPTTLHDNLSKTKILDNEHLSKNMIEIKQVGEEIGNNVMKRLASLRHKGSLDNRMLALDLTLNYEESIDSMTYVTDLKEKMKKCLDSEQTEQSKSMSDTATLTSGKWAKIMMFVASYAYLQDNMESFIPTDIIRKQVYNIAKVVEQVNPEQATEIMSLFNNWLLDERIIDMVRMKELYNMANLSSKDMDKMYEKFKHTAFKNYLVNDKQWHLLALELSDKFNTMNLKACSKISLLKLYKSLLLPDAKYKCLADIRDYLCKWMSSVDESTDENKGGLDVISLDTSSIGAHTTCGDMMGFISLMASKVPNIASRVRTMCSMRGYVKDDILSLPDISIMDASYTE